MTTSEPSRRRKASRTLSSEAPPASPSVLPGSSEARQMTVTSGLKCAASSRLSGPLGLLERMLLGSCAWNSTVALLTWKPLATPSGRSLFRLAVSMPRTAGSGSGFLATPVLWPTPGARDYKDTPGMATIGTNPDGSSRTRIDQLPRSVYAVEQTPKGGGSLNPQWVEWLMGYPEGWTDLGDSATPSSRKSSRKSAGPSSPLNTTNKPHE